jgi:hypothetical protein
VTEFIELAKLTPPVLYLVATIYLFRTLQSEQKERRTENDARNEAWRKDITAILDRYHNWVTAHTVTLQNLVEKLNDDDHK